MHDHSHSHFHAHDHHPHQKITRAFLFSILLNLGFVVAEVIAGVFSGSVALLADAGHNFQDVLALSLSAVSLWLANRPAPKTHTYGYRKMTILSSLANAILLMLACGAIIWESIDRFRNPQPVEGTLMIQVALVGVLVNGISAFLFRSSSELNSRGAFLHLMMDALISLGVAIAGFLVLKTGYSWIDPVVSIAVAVIILAGTWNLLKNSLGLAMDTIPEGINVDELKSHLRKLPEIVDIHHVHIWPLSTLENAMTAHVLVNPELVREMGHTSRLLVQINEEVKHHFAIHHLTLQIEIFKAGGGSGDQCDFSENCSE